MRRRSRLERADQLEAGTARLAAGEPQRQVAADLGLARGTLQEWGKPVAVGAAPAALAAWVETPEGVRWLHQLVMAAHVAITLPGGAGVRVVCQFLERTAAPSASLAVPTKHCSRRYSSACRCPHDRRADDPDRPSSPI